MLQILSKALGLVSPRWRTFGEWLDVYEGIIEHRDYRGQTLKNKRILINHIRPVLGRHPIRSLRPAHVNEFVNSFLPGKASTARKALMELRDVFAEAIQNGWAEENPALAVSKPAYSVKRQPMTLELWVAMHEVALCSPIKWLAPALELALVTGQRRADIAKMRFDDVVEDARHGPLLVVEKFSSGEKSEDSVIGIPLSLRLRTVDNATGAVAVDISVGEVIDRCRAYTKKGEALIRKSNGEALARPEMLSYRFEKCINSVGEWPEKERPTLDECRSLSSRLYREQGIHPEILMSAVRRAFNG